MLLNTFPMYAAQCTNITANFASSTFTIITPQKNQCGLALWVGTTGLEISGAGASYGPTSITLINGVTSTLQFMNSNGSSLQLVANGNGMPLYNTILTPTTISGAPYLWLTAGSTNLSVRVTYFFNDAFPNS